MSGARLEEVADARRTTAVEDYVHYGRGKMGGKGVDGGRNNGNGMEGLNFVDIVPVVRYGGFAAPAALRLA